MKKILRQSVLSQRRALSDDDVQVKSRQIKDTLFSLDEFREAHTILFYVSYDNEVFTHDMIKESLARNKRVVVPKVVRETNSLLLSALQKWDNLVVGEYDILEPRQDTIQIVSPSAIDLMILPGVVFDLKGNRIGHGMWYYDRLLEEKGMTYCIGLAFECQIVEHIEAEKHDVQVDEIITEERIISCS